jgi:hypothetical protein
MKNTKVLMLLVAAILVGFGIAYAAATLNVAVNAQVADMSPEFTTVIKELTTAGQDVWSGTTVSAMNFGTLTHLLDGGAEAGVWYSQKYYCVLMFTQNYGKAYEVKSTCTGLSSGANSLPAGSFALTPAYVAGDEWSPGVPQGTQPTGAVLGSLGSAVATGKSIYKSEASNASARIIRAFYSIPTNGGFTGAVPVPLSQATGTYTGTVTITIAAY